MLAIRTFLRELCHLISHPQAPLYPRQGEGSLNEPHLYRAALYHQVVPLIDLLQTQLRQIFPGLSRDFLAKVQIYTYANLSRQLLLERALAELAVQLENAAVPFRIFKGPVLAYELYDPPHLRTYGDLDILIREADFVTVERQLQASGYEVADDLYAVFPTSVIRRYAFARHFISSDNRPVAIDVHLNLSGKLHPFQFDRRTFWESSRKIVINQRTYTTFDLPHQAVYALYHAFKHYYFKLLWLIDLQRLLNHVQFDANRFRQLIAHYRMDHLWQLYLTLTEELFGTVPAWVKNTPSRPTYINRWLDADRILNGFLPISQSKARLFLPMLYLKGVLAKVRYWLRQLFPPREVMRAFYENKTLKPSWFNYLRLRQQAMRELFLN